MAHGTIRREPDELEKESLFSLSSSILQYLAITIYLCVVSSERGSLSDFRIQNERV
jgi:hypothetical protein